MWVCQNALSQPYDVTRAEEPTSDGVVEGVACCPVVGTCDGVVNAKCLGKAISEVTVVLAVGVTSVPLSLVVMVVPSTLRWDLRGRIRGCCTAWC